MKFWEKFKQIFKPEPNYVANFVSVSPDDPDVRDYVWNDLPDMNLPSALDHSHNLIVIENQLHTGSCVAQSGTSILEALKAAVGLPKVQLSRLHLYWHARDYSDATRNKDAGTTLRNSLKAMFHNGVARESDWPFDVNRINDAPPADVDMSALSNNVKRYERIKDTTYQNWSLTMRRIKEALATGHMVYIAMPLDESFFYLGPETPHNYKGVTGNANANWVGNHAVAIVGYYSIGVSEYFIIANSWGTSWGANGFGHIPVVTIASDVFDVWVIKEFNGVEIQKQFAQRLDVAKLYVSIFGRAPDVEGMRYWSSRLLAGETLAQLADAMYATEPARKYYPTGMSNDQIVTSFYRNVLGREPDQDGLAFWTHQMNTYGFGPTIDFITKVVFEYKSTDPAGIASRKFFIDRCYKAVKWAESGGGVTGADTAIA